MACAVRCGPHIPDCSRPIFAASGPAFPKDIETCRHYIAQLYKETIAVYSENNKEPINIFCE